MTASMWLRSAPDAPGNCGVPTQMKCTSPNWPASASEVLKRSFPEVTARSRMSANSGSKNGARPSPSAVILATSLSTPSTSWPISAMHAACTAPRYPVPITVMRMPPSPEDHAPPGYAA